MDAILDLIRSYGWLFYVITFFWTFLEGETFVIFAGLAAAEGILRLDILIACAWIGSFLGDQLWFLLGRLFGPRIVERFPKARPRIDVALAEIERHGTWFILTFRFVYLVRNVGSVACGMSGIAWVRFASLNFIAAGIWAFCFAGAGFLLGHAFQQVLGEVAKGFGLGMLGLFLAVVLTIVWVRRRRKAAEAPAPVQQAGGAPVGAVVHQPTKD